MAVVTSPDKARGRFLKTEGSPIKQAALDLKLPVHDYEKVHAGKVLEAVKALSPDFLIVVSFGFILSRDFLNLPKISALNIHPSLLPCYRGASPMPWTLLEGDRRTGVSVICMNERMDAGDVAMQASVALEGNEDLPMLEKNLSVLGGELIVRVLDEWKSGTIHPAPQDEKSATYTRKFTKEDARLNFSLSAEVLERRVRALRGWPGTFCLVQGKRLVVHEAVVVSGSGVPGTRLASDPGKVEIACGSDALSLKNVQLEGKKPMPTADFLRGFPLKAAEKFE